MTAVYHITHVKNLLSIYQQGGLCSDSRRDEEGLSPIGIAYAHIKERRLLRRVPIEPGGVLADYVPFYFAPRSPMLYAIHMKQVEDYDGNQQNIVYICYTVESIIAHGQTYVFTDGHAAVQYSKFMQDPARLDQIDWEIMNAKYWNDTQEDGDRKRRRQAEFLVHVFCPWSVVTEIAVFSRTAVTSVQETLAGIEDIPSVVVRPGWYC